MPSLGIVYAFCLTTALVLYYGLGWPLLAAAPISFILVPLILFIFAQIASSETASTSAVTQDSLPLAAIPSVGSKIRRLRESVQLTIGDLATQLVCLPLMS